MDLNEYFVSSLYCIFSDFECPLWPLKAVSVKVMIGKVPLFFIAKPCLGWHFCVRQGVAEIHLPLVPYLVSSQKMD